MKREVGATGEASPNEGDTGVRSGTGTGTAPAATEVTNATESTKAARPSTSRFLVAAATLGTVSGFNRWAIRRLTGVNLAVLGPARIRPMILGTGVATLIASLYLNEE